MNLSDLICGQRYTFYYKTKYGDKIFRANFLTVFHYKQYTSLILNKYESEKEIIKEGHVWYMDPRYVYKIETLAEIFNGKTKLPDDVLHVIDDFC
jgi:hypothetical protein